MVYSSTSTAMDASSRAIHRLGAATSALKGGSNRLALQDFTIVTYLPEYRMAQINFTHVVRQGTDVIMFSVVPTYSGKIATGRIPVEYLKAATTARDRNGGRVLVCVGGGSRSGAFPTVAASSALRQSLIVDLIEFCKHHRLDGVLP